MKSGASAEGEVEHVLRISESERCCSFMAMRTWYEVLKKTPKKEKKKKRKRDKYHPSSAGVIISWEAGSRKAATAFIYQMQGAILNWSF